jgi:hypothetical protein
VTTRRVLLERALVAERTALWDDFTEAMYDAVDPVGTRVSFLVARIRLASEALGYPSDPDTIEPWLLNWYSLVETYPTLGLYARPWYVDDETEPVEIDSAVRRHHDGSIMGGWGEQP